ncbi:nucleoside deaminase [Paenibacillus alkalitolerans]|uniref:nucleoside deaminase n=1 Tax=Paenibacillus alkalitolerans TaxID=2799335 RepID=UPI0018F5ADC3|nr:nucleoside deaminase [Paenibacillus alkalitolerans]
MDREEWMREAVRLARENAANGQGGPFGAIVVKDGRIIAAGVNQVTTSNDPTAHAEVQAIRAACKELGTFQLSDCEIYTSCEPCPMCIGAIYWARPKAVYYAATKEEAAAIGFDDHFIYEEIDKPIEHRRLPMRRMTPDGYHAPFDAWSSSADKVEY